MSKAINISESGLMKTGHGKIDGIITTATSSGTLVILDGTESSTAATGTLTSSGACVPASHGQTVLTSNGTNVTADEVIVIGAKTYTFVEVASADGEINIGEDAAVTLDNVKAAVNGTDGINTAHPYFRATTNTDTTQVITARALAGTAATTALNALDTTTTASTLSWADTTYGGGTGDSNPAVTTAAATITIGERIYTATLELSEISGASAVADQILWVTSEAVFLDNFKKTLNGSGNAGTEYSTGTRPNYHVVATTNSDTEQTVVAKVAGVSGNAIATTDTLANYAWGATTLASGAGADAEVILNTYTPSAGASIELDADFERGLYITVGGTSISATVLMD